MTYAKLKASDLEPRAARRRLQPERLLVAPPDLGSWPRLALVALAVTLIVGVILGAMTWGRLKVGLGDTDDATRLVAVRALLNGQGWWDEAVTRFQPPMGLWMHWSRLLDGGIAGLDRLFRVALSADDAEMATRFTWPLLWIFPSALAALATAKRLGLGLMSNAAVIVAAVILASDIGLYVQYRPGRIDHHDVQMALSFVTLAGAILSSPGVLGAVIAGAATGLGLAVGLEGMVFEAAVGAALALRFLLAPQSARAAQAYGLALTATTALAFAVQTPPWRWAVEGCDALALNMVAAIAVSGLGLAAGARLTARRPWFVRLAMLAVLGAAAGAVYLGLYPHCIHGFFADVDPRIRPIWLNYVQEVRSIQVVTKLNLQDGVGHIAPWALGVVAWLVLGIRRERWTDFAWWTSGLCLAIAIATAAGAIRMTGYAEWFAVPLVAAATVEVVTRLQYRSLLVLILAAAVASPVTAAGLSQNLAGMIAPLFVKKKPVAKGARPARPAAKAAPKPQDHCFDSDSYAVLARARPTGMVLGEVDLGPFVLGETGDSAMAGPYHRMSFGILRAHSILKAPADGGAEALTRRYGVTYVLECRMHARHGDRVDMKPTALQKRLDAGLPPAWLLPLSPKGASLQVYRLRPPAPPLPALPKLAETGKP